MKLQRRLKGVEDLARAGQTAFGRSIYPTENKPDKGAMNGSCNRTACQRPLADEPVHQFMARPFTSGQRLYYCATCARDFDAWDHRSGDAVRITREAKEPEWSGSPCPEDPDNFWIDDDTGERVNAATGERTAPEVR